MQALADAFKADPGAIAWGGGSAGGTDDLLVRLMAEQLGLPPSRVNYIAFAGGGAALAAVLGGQVTAAVSGYGEFAGQIAAGELRALAISAPARIAGIEAPTLRESGIALDLANWRAVVAPPGLSDAERDALGERIARMARSEPWKKTLEQNGWEDTFLAGADFRQFLLAEQARVEAVLQRLAASETTPSRRLAMSVTPSTLPITVTSIFAVVLIGFLVQRRSAAPAGAPAGGVAAARRCDPWRGVVDSAAHVSNASGSSRHPRCCSRLDRMRCADEGGARTDSLKDMALGLVFSSLLYVIFSRGLGVSLP